MFYFIIFNKTFGNTFELPQLTQDIFKYQNTKFYNYHEGLDYGISYKSLYAPIEGKVIFAGIKKGYGNTLVIKDDITSTYILLAHLGKIHLSEGDYFSKGKKIAESGNSGNFTTGAHLHLEIYKNGIPQNSQIGNVYIKSLLTGENLLDADINYVNYNFGDIFMKYNWENIEIEKLTKYDDFFEKVKNTSKTHNIPEKVIIRNLIYSKKTISEIIETVKNYNGDVLTDWVLLPNSEFIEDVNPAINCYYSKDYQDYSQNCLKYKNFGNEIKKYIEQGKF